MGLIRELIPCERATIGICDLGSNEYRVLAADTGKDGLDDQKLYRWLTEAWSDALHQGQPHVVVELASVAGQLPVFQDLMDRGMRRLASVPVIIHATLHQSL